MHGPQGLRWPPVCNGSAFQPFSVHGRRMASGSDATAYESARAGRSRVLRRLRYDEKAWGELLHEMRPTPQRRTRPRGHPTGNTDAPGSPSAVTRPPPGWRRDGPDTACVEPDSTRIDAPATRPEHRNSRRSHRGTWPLMGEYFDVWRSLMALGFRYEVCYLGCTAGWSRRLSHRHWQTRARRRCGCAISFGRCTVARTRSRCLE